MGFFCVRVLFYIVHRFFFCLLNVIVYVVTALILNSSFGKNVVSFINILLSVLKVFFCLLQFDWD